MWMEVPIYNVEVKSQAGNIWVKDVMTTARDRKKLCILPENLAGEHYWGYIFIYENTPEKLPHLPPKSICNFLNGSRKDAVGA